MVFLRDLFIGLLLFCMALIAFSSFASELAFKSSGVNTTNFTQLQLIQNVTNASAQIHNSLTNSPLQGIPVADVLASLFGAGAEVIKLVLETMTGLFGLLVTTVAKTLMLPDWFIGLVTAIITIVILFEVLSVAFRYRV